MTKYTFPNIKSSTSYFDKLFCRTCFTVLSSLFLCSCQKSKEATLVVEEGKTVYDVARDSQVPVDEMAKSNDLQDPYKITAGQKLDVPAKKDIIVDDEEIQQQKQQYMNEINLIENTTNSSVNDNLVEEEKQLTNETEKNKQDKENQDVNEKEGHQSIEKIEDEKESDNQLINETSNTEKSRLYQYPISNFSIDDNRPFSAERGKRQDGVYFIGEGSVYPICDGKVIYSGSVQGIKTIYISHKTPDGESFVSIYSNLTEISSHITKGVTVVKETEIGTMQQPNNLFLRISNGKGYINPIDFLHTSANSEK